MLSLVREGINAFGAVSFIITRSSKGICHGISDNPRRRIPTRSSWNDENYKRHVRGWSTDNITNTSAHSSQDGPNKAKRKELESIKNIVVVTMANCESSPKLRTVTSIKEDQWARETLLLLRER